LAYGVLKSERPFDPDIGCGRRHSALDAGHRI
jgi:hypothetical protein